MFYSQIILAKKGPLGKVWLAAHWGDKKIGRTQIFTTDISQSVQDIVNPAAPLSLRVSGHLLLGVVRIYSRKVKYLKNDVEEAAVKMKMTFKGGAGSTKDSGETDFMVVDLNPNRSPRKSKSMGVNNVVNFGEYDGGDFLSTELSNRTSILDNPLNLPGVQPVSNDQLLIPFTLDPGDGGDLGFQEWEAVQEEGDLGDPLRQIQPFSLDAESIMSGRRAMLRDPTQQSQTDESALEAVNMTLDSEIHNMKHLPTQQDDKEETWESFDQGEIGKHEEEDEDEDRHVFPPDEMLVDDDDNATNMKNSRVSDIEVVRDADSIESVKIGRVSTALSSVGNTNEKLSLATAGPSDSSVLGAPTPIPNDDEELAPPPFEEEQDQNLQFDDNSPEPKRRLFEDDTDSLLPSPDATRDSLAIDAPTPLTMTSQQEDEASHSQPPPKKKQTRKRKRRRVCFDYDEDELSSAHVKDMIRDPSDIVRDRSHPAEDISSDDEGNDLQGPQPFWRPKKTRRGSPEDIIANLSYEVLFSRPNVADSGKLDPGLLEMWIDNTAPVRNQPLKIRLRGEAGEEQERDRAEQIVKEAAASELETNEEEQRRLEVDDVEITRQEGFQVEDEQRLSIEHPDDIQDKMQEDNIEEQNVFPNEEDVPLQFDDDDDQIQHNQHAIEEGPISFEDELDGMGSPTKSVGSNFSLGAVNDMQEEHDDESPRQERGEELASAATKWHKHTVKVLDMLKRNIEDRNVPTDGDKDTDNQKDLSYDKLSYGVKRRTACGVFFELLQLKTWDFIELKQEESYCDIRISPGVRFHENPPTD